MFQFDIDKWVPRFIMLDKNGYAVAKAIEAGIKALNKIIDDGQKCHSDVASMPEWRLDELAWEYNLLYDYGQNIETKRDWIANAMRIYSIYGTPAIIKMYLGAVYDSVVVEEWWEYSGEPFHFRVVIDDIWSEENNEWATSAIERTRNVRSVLDNIIFNGGESGAEMLIGEAVSGIEIVDTSSTM